MPDYNLGKAHGKIEIDTDTRGIVQGEKSLESFEKTIKDLQKTIGQLDQTFKNHQKELDKSSGKSKEAEKSTRKFSESHKEVTKHSSSSSRSIRSYTGDLNDMIRMTTRAVAIGKQLSEGYRQVNRNLAIINSVQNFGNAINATKELVNWQRILQRTIIEGRFSYLALGRTYAELSDREKTFVKNMRQIAAVTGTVAVAHKLLSANASAAYARLLSTAAGNGPLASAARMVRNFGLEHQNAISPIRRFYNEFVSNANGINTAARGIVRGFLGFKIAKQGYEGLRKFFGLEAGGKLQAVIVGILSALTAVAPAAELAAKGIRGFAATFKGAQTLAGGLFAIPGIFATIAGAAIPLISTFKRMGTLFGDIFKADDPKKLQKALDGLPDEFKAAGRALADFKKNMQDIGDAGLKSFMGANFADEVNAINAAFSGPMKRNFQVINNAARALRQEFVGVASDGKNITGINQVFTASKTVLDNVRNSIRPFADGMRDLVVTGAKFFADYSSGANGLAQRFANWMATARETGKLRKYMDDAFAGAKDLTRGIADLGRATSTFIGAFTRMSGNNALQSFADTMARWNREAKDSALDGWIGKMGRAVKGAGFERFNEFKDILKGFKVPFEELYQAAKPFFDSIRNGFQGTFIPMVKAAMQVVESFLDAFKPFAGIIGQELAMLAGFRAINFALKPMANAIRVVGGALAALSGAKAVSGLYRLFSSKLVLGFVSALDAILPGANRATGAMAKLEGGIGRAAGVLRTLAFAGGPILAVLAVMWSAFSKADDTVASFNRTLEEGKKNVADYKDALREAFSADLGVSGKNVFDTVSQQMSDMRAQLDKAGSEDIGWWSNTAAFLKNAGLNFVGNLPFGIGDEGAAAHGQTTAFGQTKEFNDIQKAAQDAKHAKEQFDELGLSSKDLAQVVTGTQTAFDNFTGSLERSGKTDASEQLKKQRQVFTEMQADFAKAGPGNVALANAIKEIGDAGADATAKLNGLKAALRALGLDKTDEIENALAYSDALRKLGDEAANLVDSSAGLDKVFGPDGAINTKDGGANVNNLVGAVKEAVTEFQQAVIDGKPLEESWNRLFEAGQKAGEAFSFDKSTAGIQKTQANVQNLIRTMGGVPDVVDILLNIKGGDKLQEDIAKILAAVKSGQSGEITIPINGDPKNLQRVLDETIGKGKAQVNGSVVTFNSADVTPEFFSSLRQKLENAPKPQVPVGVTADPSLAGKSPAEVLGLSQGGKPIPVPITAAPSPDGGQPTDLAGLLNVPKDGVPVPIKPEAPAGAPPAASGTPAAVAPPVDNTQLDAANQKIQELQATVTQLQNQKTAIEIDVTKLDEAKTKLSELKTLIDGFTAKPVEFTIIAKGADETIAVLNRVKDAVNQLIASAGQIASVFGAAFNSVQSALTSLVASAGSQGAAFVSALAAGITAQAGVALQAAEKLAADIKARFHQSPPKKGPLSAHGDAARYAGGAFVDAYAAGMSGNNAGVSAANSFAGGIAGAAKGPYDLGKLIGMVNDFVGIGSKMADVFGQVADAIFNTIKFISDPLGKGTFFGQSKGAAFGFRRDPNISDAELQAKRDEKLQQDLQTTKKDEKALSPEQQKQADQQKADAEKQNEITSKLLDEVIAGKRIAAPTDEELAAQKKAKSDATKQSKKDAKAQADQANQNAQTVATGTTKQNQIKAKSELDFANTAQQAGANLSKALDELTPEQLAKVQSGEISVKTQEQMLAELARQTPLLQTAIDVSKDQNATQDQQISSLTTLQGLIDNLGEAKTPAAKQQKQALEGIQGTIKDAGGLTEGANPIDQASQIAGGAANMAKDVFASIQSVMDSIGAAKDIGDTLVRGFENSEDVMKTIDNVQQFIQTAAQIASAVSSGIGIAAGIAGATGGTDGGAASGGLSAASQIASLVSAGLSAVNGTIDLAQEIYRTAGKYFGEFLGFLTGGVGGQLMGDVKFLLDQNDGTLKTWSKDNPEDKRVFDNPFQAGGIREQQPQIGQINVYGGPGQDPRDMTNEMMFAVSAAGQGAGNYN